jgi:Fibronectin type III domain
MPRIRLNLSKLSISEKLDLAKQINGALNGNANFPTPTPSLATLSAAASALQTAHDEAVTARQESRNKTAVQNQAEDELDDALTRLAGYVSSVSGSDEALVTSAGMNFEQPKTPSSTAATPQSFAATTGDSDGEIDTSWNSVAGAQSYVVEQSLQAPPAANWTHVQTTIKSSHTVTGLVSGTRYYFRVAAISAGGQSGWSDISTRIAP